MSQNDPFTVANVDKLPKGAQMLASIRRQYNECIKIVSKHNDNRNRTIFKVTCLCCKYMYPNKTTGLMKDDGIKFYAADIKKHLLKQSHKDAYLEWIKTLNVDQNSNQNDNDNANSNENSSGLLLPSLNRPPPPINVNLNENSSNVQFQEPPGAHPNAHQRQMFEDDEKKRQSNELPNAFDIMMGHSTLVTDDKWVSLNDNECKVTLRSEYGWNEKMLTIVGLCKYLEANFHLKQVRCNACHTQHKHINVPQFPSAMKLHIGISIVDSKLTAKAMNDRLVSSFHKTATFTL